MTTFEALQKFYKDCLYNGMVNSSRRISANTKASIKNNIIRVQLYNTEVLGLDLSARRVCINTGGWNTVITRKRINEACEAFGLPYSVSTKAGVFKINGSPAQRYNEFAL